ncbi:MAG TPA: hypothetical protein VE258_19310 [Ktedonobacterales bacterium]|nr:hypothetical protein [Ktedonobacterales bacterium]
MRPRMFLIQLATLAVGAALTIAAAWAGPQPEAATSAAPEAGVWTPKEVDFVYRAFTSKYTCDGLRDKVRGIVLKLGARADADVRTYGCMQASRPEPWPNVSIRIHVLRPAANDSAATVAAHWQTVDFAAGRDPTEVAGECELIAQVREHVLPLFTARNITGSTTCVPRALVIGATQLKADVFVPEPSARSAQR